MRLQIRHTAACLVYITPLVLSAIPVSATEDANVEPHVGTLQSFYRAEKPGCDIQYDLPFYFTVVAMGSQTYQKMFDAETPAYQIVLEWEKNTRKVDSTTYPVLKPIKDALKALGRELGQGEPSKLSFRTMVEYRLNKFPSNLEGINRLIGYLVDAEFRFPLFDLSTGVSSERKLKLLDEFLESYKGPNRGGMGNVPMDAFYTARVEPWVYSNEFIHRVILPMQGQVTPIFKNLYDCDRNLILSGDAGWCCCNDDTHGNDYRKCFEIGDTTYNCRERDGFCSIGTLKTCPGHVH